MTKRFSFGSPASLDESDFIQRFGSVYEHSPWIAERAFNQGINESHDQIDLFHALMKSIFLAANKQEQLGVILARPDLAGKAALAGELTHESTNEQASAGIDSLKATELSHFTQLNDAYKEKFKFPFIMAVKGSNKHAIISGFEDRINNNTEQEFERAINEINKIAAFRLDDM